MNLSIEQIIAAVIAIVILLIIGFNGPFLLRAVADELNWDIGLTKEEIETQNEAEEITESLTNKLNLCLNPGGEIGNKPDCFCLEEPIDLPTNYNLWFRKDNDKIKVDLVNENGRNLEEYSISNADLKGCYSYSTCYSNLQTGVNLKFSDNFLINFNSISEEFDNEYIFLVDYNEGKRELHLVDKRYAYTKIGEGVNYCSGKDIEYTSEMTNYFVGGFGTLNDCYSECSDVSCDCFVYGCNKKYGEVVGKGESCGNKRDDIYLFDYFANPNLYSNSQESLVVDYALKYNIPPLLTLSLVAQESKFLHCCRTSDAVHWKDCAPVLDMLTCDPSLILKSYDDSSLGIMQINQGVHKDCYLPYTLSDRSSSSICKVSDCELTTAYNINCNLDAGMNLLRRNYELYGDGCKNSELYKEIEAGEKSKTEYKTFWNGCNNCKTSEGLNYYEYRGWDAALRAYNGLACRDEKESDYVEDVRAHVIEFSNAQI